MAPKRSDYRRPPNAPSEAVVRSRARVTQKKTADEQLRRDLLTATGQKDTGQSLADLRAASRGTNASPESVGYHTAFGGRQPVEASQQATQQRPAQAPQARQTNGGGVDVSAAKRMTDAATAATAAAGMAGVLPSAAAAMSWSGIPEAAAATAQQPAEPQSAPEASQTPTSRVTIDGQRETLDEKTGRYVGSIANPPPRTDRPQTPSESLSRADVNSPRIQGLLDAAAGIKQADPNVYTPDPADASRIAAQYGSDAATRLAGGRIQQNQTPGTVSYAGDGTNMPKNVAPAQTSAATTAANFSGERSEPQNIAAGDPDMMKKAPAAGRNASSATLADASADPMNKKAPAAGRSASSDTAVALSQPHAATTPAGKVVDASDPAQARDLSIKDQVSTAPARITPPDMRPRAEREASNEAARQSAVRDQISNPGLRTAGAWDALTKGNLSEMGSHIANNTEAGLRSVAGAAGDLLDQGGASGSPLVTALQNAGRSVISEGPNISPETMKRYADARHAQTGQVASADPNAQDPNKKKRFADIGR